jgi:hypothetical protein
MPSVRPRFTLRSLMIAVAAAAGLLALSLSPTGMKVALIVAFGLLYLALIGVSWWMFRGFRRLSALGFGVVATLTNVSCAALSIFERGLAALVPIWLGWFCTFPLIIGLGVAWATTATRRTARPRRSRLLAWPLVLAAAFAPLTMLVTPWPLRLAFLASRPAMERLADRVAAGHAISRPEWAGLIQVVGSATDPGTGNVVLITDPNPSGRSGFVRLDPSAQVKGGRGYYGPFFNLNINEHMDGRWWYQEED